MQVWPFKPILGITESLEWLTDVLRAKSSEQRIALRSAPRRQFQLRHLLRDNAYSSARAMVRTASVFLVPDWVQIARPGSIVLGTSVDVVVDISCIDIEAGDRAILWTSDDDWEQVEVEAITSSGLTLVEVQNSHANPLLMPLRESHAPAGISVGRSPPEINQIEITQNIYETFDLSASEYPQYRGHDVVTDCPFGGS